MISFMTVIFIVYLEHILKNEIISKPLLMKNGHNTIVNLRLAWRLGDSDGPDGKVNLQMYIYFHLFPV